MFCKVQTHRCLGCERRAQWETFYIYGWVMDRTADLWVLLLDVPGDDTQADLGHFLQFGVPGAARGAMPGLQLVQQVHHPLKDLQYNINRQQRTEHKGWTCFHTLQHLQQPKAIQYIKYSLTCI